MPVSFDQIQKGRTYSRPELARLWGYAGHEAISRGVITPARTRFIILFITHEKQEGFTQYQDSFEGGILNIEGETNHANDNRIINAEKAGDEIHLFYRPKHHMNFSYEGRIFLSRYRRNADKPSHLRFYTEESVAKADSDVETEEATHGGVDETFVPDPEGNRKMRMHVSYERSPRNRAEAIRIHGTNCLVCGFDFNKVYGAELARDYIEVHHNRSITEQAGKPVNPATDLSPLCSNCHSMAHRERGVILSVAALKELIQRRQK